LIQAQVTATGACATPMAPARVVVGHIVGELVGGGADPTTIVRSCRGSSCVVERGASGGSRPPRRRRRRSARRGRRRAWLPCIPRGARELRGAGWRRPSRAPLAAPHRRTASKIPRYIVGQVCGSVGADRYLPRRFQQRVGILETIAAIRTQTDCPPRPPGARHPRREGCQRSRCRRGRARRRSGARRPRGRGRSACERPARCATPRGAQESRPPAVPVWRARRLPGRGPRRGRSRRARRGPP
jgi:hypothetical protein